MNGCDELIRPALESAFSQSLQIEEDNGDCRILVPFERSDRDQISLWVSQQGDSYRITDEGETYGMLYLSNIDLDQEKRANRVDMIKERFDLESAKHEVSTVADEDDLGERILDVVQAMQALSYLSYTRKPYTTSEFSEDVGLFLEDEGFAIDRNPFVPGAAEEHRVDFGIQGQPQPTYLEAIHAEDTSTATSRARHTAFKWIDINKRNADVMRISVIDDVNGEFSHDAERILTDYSDSLVPWSQSDQLLSTISP